MVAFDYTMPGLPWPEAHTHIAIIFTDRNPAPDLAVGDKGLLNGVPVRVYEWHKWGSKTEITFERRRDVVTFEATFTPEPGADEYLRSLMQD